MTFSTLKRMAIILPIVFLFALWVLVHTVLRQLHQFPDVLILGGLVLIGVAAFAFGVFEIVKRLERQIVAQNRQLRALLRVGRAASSSLMVSELLDAAIDATLDILHADAAEVWLLDSDGRLRLARERGIEGDEHVEGQVSVQDVPPELAADGSSVAVAYDTSQSTRAVPVRIATLGFQTYRVVPLHHRNELVGMLGVAARTRTALGGDWELGLLEGIGEWISLALANGQLHEEALDGAVLDERLRIARELHDGVAQVLTYTNAQTLAVQRLLAAGREEDASAELTAMEHATRQVYGDVHEAILGLRTSLERPGLVPALRECLVQYGRIAGTTPQLVLSDAVESIELPAATEVQLIRVVQEALANVRKHAAATAVFVRVQADDGDLRVEIEDNGRGFTPASSQPTGWPRFGLQTMQERAQALGGTFELDSRPGAGTTVTVTVPLVETKEGEVANLAR